MKQRTEQQPDAQTRPSQLPFFNRQTGSNAVVQTKLTVGSSNDAHEHEANRTADMVMRKPENSAKNGTYTEGSLFTPSITPVIQRACAHCEKENEQTAQRKETGGNTGGFTAPDSVSRAISRGGSALDSNAKTFMESRFNRSFDNVQVHTDGESAASARDISARAYTSGNHIVFGDGQYQPNTEGGRHLLAHELTHVVQQGSEINRKEQTVYRSVSHFSSCPPNVNSAPPDAAAEQVKVDSKAMDICAQVAEVLETFGVTGEVLDVYTARFGSPPAVGAGFMNRLTGKIVKTEIDAFEGEMNILARRFRIIARLFSQPISYRCIGPGGSPSDGIPHCGAFAWSGRGEGKIFLCPSFWTSTADTNERAAVLVHESFHVVFGRSSPRKVGEVSDNTLGGSGKNLIIADCNSGFACDLMGINNPADTCPAP